MKPTELLSRCKIIIHPVVDKRTAPPHYEIRLLIPDEALNSMHLGGFLFASDVLDAYWGVPTPDRQYRYRVIETITIDPSRPREEQDAAAMEAAKDIWRKLEAWARDLDPWADARDMEIPRESLPDEMMSIIPPAHDNAVIWLWGGDTAYIEAQWDDGRTRHKATRNLEMAYADALASLKAYAMSRGYVAVEYSSFAVFYRDRRNEGGE